MPAAAIVPSSAGPTASAVEPASKKRGAAIADTIASSADSFQWKSYSLNKLLALDDYCTKAPAWRVACVLFLTPLPAFVGSVLPAFVSLKSPQLDAMANRSLVLHCFIAIFLVTFGTIVLTLGATATPPQQYPLHKAVLISAVTTAAITAFEVLLSTLWRFPVPFFDLLGAPIWMLAMWLVHLVLMRREFRQFPHLARTLFDYRMPLALQSSQFGIYTVLTIVFDRVPTIYQVLMVVVFPVVKFGLKRLLARFTHALEEMSGEVVVSTIEICASLYQSMVMQTTPSALALVAIMGVDAVQGFLATRLFMGRNMVTPKHEVFPRALAILRQCQQDRIDSRKFAELRAKLKADEATVVAEALQLASAIDRMLLVEYIEVSVPIVNAFFLLVTYQTTSTLYNTRLNRFYVDTDQVLLATKSVLFYSLLQGLSLVVFFVVLRRRHRMSALYHLAFVLEYHMRSIQGKLLVFFTVIFYFTLLHYGADFTLRFDVAVLMREMKLPTH